MTKKILIIAFIVLMASISLVAITAHAQTATSSSSGITGAAKTAATVVGDVVGGIALLPITIPVIVITFLAGFIGSAFIQLMAYFVGYGLALNATILDPTNAVIGIGWVAARDLANLGFVLVIIIIAFATILRIKSYGMDQTLWKLIAAALLVNFSLTIAGVFVDFAGVVSNFFLSKITGTGVAGLASSLMQAFLPQSLLQAKGFAATAAASIKSIFTFSGAVNLFGNAFFVTLFTFLIAIAFIVLAVMLFMRFVVLTFLLVLVPIAWLFWAFPALKHLWDKWWDEFLRWVFFLPSALFFLYLAITIANKRADYIGKLADQTAALGAAAGGPIDNSLIENFPAKAGQILVLLGFVWGGLILSHKISGTFSGIASSTGGWVAGKLTKAGKGAGTAFMKTGGAYTAQKMAAAGSRGGAVTRAVLAPTRAVGKGLMYLGVGAGAPVTAGTILNHTWQGAKKGFIKKKLRDWQCRTCGYTLTDVHPPAVCPGPTHPAGAPSSFIRV